MLPDLEGGLQLCALLDAAQANDDRRSVLGRSAVQGCSALRAERLYSAIAALRDLDVTPGLAAEHEAFDGRRDHSAERRAGQDLAVRAMAERHPRRVNLRGEGD